MQFKSGIYGFYGSWYGSYGVYVSDKYMIGRRRISGCVGRVTDNDVGFLSFPCPTWQVRITYYITYYPVIGLHIY